MGTYEERLSEEVRRYSFLYDPSLKQHRDKELIRKTWRDIARTLGKDENKVRAKWKSMRDRFVKAKRKVEQQSKETDFIAPFIFNDLNWLSAFVKHRERDLQSPLENGAYSDDTDNSRERPQISLRQIAEDSGVTGTLENSVGMVNGETPIAVPQLSPMPQLAFVTQLAPGQQSPQVGKVVLTKMPPVSQGSEMSNSQNQTMTSWSPSLSAQCHEEVDVKNVRARDEQRLVDKSHDEDELFLLSFVPALKRLSPQKRSATKIKLQQIMYDAEFNL